MTKFEKLLLRQAIYWHNCDMDEPPGAWDFGMELMSYLLNRKTLHTCSKEVRQYISKAKLMASNKTSAPIKSSVR